MVRVLHVTTSTAFEPVTRARVDRAIRFGLVATAGGHAARVEVHAKAAPPRRSWRVHVPSGRTRTFARRRDAVAYRELHGGEMSVNDRALHTWVTGRAYDGVPG